MRKRARQREGLADDDKEEEGSREHRYEEEGEKKADSHINFFADLESGVSFTSSNKSTGNTAWFPVLL